MHFSLENRTVSLSVGEFAGFSLGPQESGGGPQGLWRAQLGQHWHNELQKRTLAEAPAAQFEVVIDGRITHRGWTFVLSGRIDQQIAVPSGALAKEGLLLREIKSVMRPLPAEETELRADYPAYFLQLSAYVVLRRSLGARDTRAELVFVEAGSGLAQTIALTPFDEALVFHQFDALIEFLNLRLRATARRRSLQFQPPFQTLRPGQETIQSDLFAAFDQSKIVPRPQGDNQPNPKSKILLLEAPTGYGKTGCVLEFALGQLKAGRFARLIWLTGKSTGQIHVMQTLQAMTSGHSSSSLSTVHSSLAATPVAAWQVRNKSEHCVNHTFHCVREGCDYLRDGAERWPGSGLSRFYLDESQPHDLETLRAAGRAAQICPYEITRAALPFNDVWIGDYNYIFAPDNRGLFFDQPGFDPAETLLVIDEAHNLPARVAGAHSHSANESEARLLLAELDHLQAPAALVLAVEEWTLLLASLQPAESLDPVVEAEVHDLLERLAALTTTQPLDYTALGPRHSEVLWGFAALNEWMQEARGDTGPQLKIETPKSKILGLLWVARAGQLEFTCVDASAAIGETLRPFGGAILMSATLQPYAEFAESCGLDSCGSELARDKSAVASKLAPTGYATLHAPTPWRAGAYDVAVDLRVDTTFRQRASHYGTTAATIVEMQQAAKGVIAVFFPSYAYAEAVQKTLSDYGAVLRTALQPKLPDLAAQAAWVEENLVFSDVLLLVLGSSFAEGIDLLGGRVTHAIVVGPALPEVNAVQKARITALNGHGRDAAFRRVYQIPGLQKVNQGLGRLVRAPGQKARVLLHCRRFAEPSYASLLAADYQLFAEIAADSDLHRWLGATQP